MTAHVRDELCQWLEEGLAEVNEEGAASKVVVEHVDATGRSTDIWHAKSGAPAWGSATQMADGIYRITDRHARGLIGHQQFRACLFFGPSERPVRFMPFGIAGAMQFGPVPGGLATEAPNGVGLQQQNMRHVELMIQHGFQERRHTVETLMTQNRNLKSDYDAAVRELHDCWVAIKELTAAFMEIATKVQVDVINAKRNAELLTDAAGLLPAAINGVTGKPIFPVAAADSELMRKLVKLMDGAPGEAAKLLEAGSAAAQAAGTDGQAAWAMLMGRLDEIRKDGVARTKRIEEMAGEAAGMDLANALKDAAGKAVVSLRSAGPKANGGGSGGNGAAVTVAAPAQPAPEPAPSQPTVEGEATDPFASFGQEILAALEGGAGDMVLGMMRAKGQGALADKAERLRDVLKARAAQDPTT